MLLVTLGGFIALQLYTLLMIVGRGTLFRTKIYRPMIWNLFLSLSPLLIQLGAFIVLIILAALINQAESVPQIFVTAVQVLVMLGIFIWALFFPNATYLITELNFSHRKKDDTVPEYYDIIMVFTLAATGVINALVSLSIFHLLILMISGPPTGSVPLASWLIVGLYALASSFAIYLGREIRFNSWDLFHPLYFIKKLWQHFTHTAHQRRALGYTLFFSGILIIGHLIFFPLVYAALL